MLQKLKQREQRAEGFTIIEVLIVLAIAGLILLIVFLAVPALQRNAHNTQRKNDVSSILGAMNEYVNNNGGVLPSASCTGNCDTTDGNWLSNAKLGFYTTAKVNFVAATGSVPSSIDTKTVYILAGYKCGATPAAAPSSTNATDRNYVAYYAVETGGGSASQCQDE